MQLANAFRTNTAWIINVGDVKHHELPAEHFMHLAYDFDAWPRNSVLHFLTLWARREFGGTHHEEIAQLVAEYSVREERRGTDDIVLILGSKLLRG
jgi:hypothetical protein